MTTVADVVTTYTDDAIKAKLLGYLQAANAPVTDWNSGAFVRSLMVQWQQVLITYAGVPNPDPQLRQRIVAGGLPLLPDTPTSEASAWLTLVADQWFKTTRNFDLLGNQFAGTFTVQNVTLTCDGSHGPYSVTPGSHIVRSPVTGNRYISNGTGTIPTGGSVTIAFRSEFQQNSGNGFNYSDGPGTLTDLSANPLIGVTASNVAPNFSAVSTSPNPSVGAGTMTVAGATPAAPTGYDVQILTDGQVGTATFQYRANGGPWVGPNTTSASFTIPSGPTLTFVNDGLGSNPSFVHGDRYYFTSPGTPITTAGVDPESDQALLLRILARWPNLDAIPAEKHSVWAKQASVLVTRVRVSQDSTRPGYYVVTIAGKANPLSGGIQTAVQLYIDQRESISERADVQLATVYSVTMTGTAYVPAAKMAAVQAAVAARWNDYVNGTDIGGIIRGVVLEQFLRDAGAINATSISPIETALGATFVAVPVDIIASGLTWVAV
jgi:hypothetical protein